jgi:DNA-binding CsgD family transcriptional regulator
MDAGPSRSHRTDDGWRPRAIFAAILLAIAALLGADLATDWTMLSTSPLHLALEGLGALGALGAAAWVLLALRSGREEVQRLAGDLAASREEALRWKGEASELLRGLSQAIDHQFDRWELSPAEREVALLLLKGLSTREIAELRATREPTVRQQAQGIYRKAGLLGRAELAAFFLEDLLAPAPSNS